MLLEILGRSYFCDILLTLQHQPKSFNDILRDIKVSSSTLNRRIKELTSYNLIEPIVIRVNDENRIKYRLTKKGYLLIKELIEFTRLANKLEEVIAV